MIYSKKLLILFAISTVISCNNPNYKVIEKWGNGNPKETKSYENKDDTAR